MMGASKKLAAANAMKQLKGAAAPHEASPDTLDGLYAVGGSIASIFTDGMGVDEIEDCANELFSLLNQIETTKPHPEFRQVVIGAMRAIGFEPVK
ncbi:hypothetical protein [Janthinobacterium sp. HLX7-2]|uniref:hypothetical protein n=1 Tax=Janthinobacterium sp. HLX7-2 TaxID=1259331 RepID=UPI003F215808